VKPLSKCIYRVYNYYLSKYCDSMYVNLLMLDASKEELISPCACTENLEFVHVRCLEKSVYNVTSKPTCMYCKDLLPLELKYKPLIEVSYMKGLTIAKYSYRK